MLAARANDIFYVNKFSPAVERVGFGVTNYYTYKEHAILGAGVRLVESDMRPCDMTERHPEIEQEIESCLKSSHEPTKNYVKVGSIKNSVSITVWTKLLWAEAKNNPWRKYSKYAE